MVVAERGAVDFCYGTYSNPSLGECVLVFAYFCMKKRTRIRTVPLSCTHTANFK